MAACDYYIYLCWVTFSYWHLRQKIQVYCIISGLDIALGLVLQILMPWDAMEGVHIVVLHTSAVPRHGCKSVTKLCKW